jgi:hypothetical protein
MGSSPDSGDVRATAKLRQRHRWEGGSHEDDRTEHALTEAVKIDADVVITIFFCSEAALVALVGGFVAIHEHRKGALLAAAEQAHVGNRPGRRPRRNR